MDDVIRKVYYNLSTGFGSIAKTHEQAAKINPKIKKEHVKAFLEKQEIKQVKKRSTDNSYIPYAPRDEYQIDLADFGAGSNTYRYGFFCIDAFSKYLVVVPIRGKTAPDCVKALDVAIEKMHIPNYVYSDDGGEFKGVFDERLKYYFIEHIVTRTHAPFAERAIRTVKEGINIRLAATHTDKSFWWKMLDYVVKQYNERPHVTTGEPPNDILHLSMEHDKDWIEELRGRISAKAHFNRKYPKINVGDKVKILRKPGKRGEFKIGFQAWTSTVHTVTKIEYQDGDKLFYLTDYPRALRNHEIMKVEDVQKPPIRRVRGKQAP